METVTEVIGGGRDSGEGRVARREMAVKRMSEGDMTLSKNSTASALASAVTFVVVNMVFNVVIDLSSK